MSQYRAYPAYKDSGIEWIGQVPEHWQVKRLKHLISQCQNGVWGDDPLEDGSDTLCIRVADFDRDNNVVIYNPSTYRQITKEHQDSRLVSKGDILLEKSGGGAQTLVGANVRYLGEEPAVCSNFVAVIKPSKMAESAWLNYLMASMYALKINLRSIKQSTGIQNLDSEQYLDEGVAAPSLDEQATIAAALDRETARIDALVEKKTRFIELLKEKRQALITHAVTKGLDRNAKMKDSGIEWIGQVPEHWEATKLKHVAAFSGGGTPSKENPDYWNGCIPWVSPKDMKHEVITDSIDHITTKGLENSATKLIDSGAVLLVARSGILRHTIPVGINNVPVSLNQDMKALSLDETRVRPRFILRWVQGLNRSLLGIWAKEGATVESLEHEYVANTRLPLPDLKEQDAILATLDLETARIDALISKTEQSITLLKERRAAFITAAVTGQIDLRGKQ